MQIKTAIFLSVLALLLSACQSTPSYDNSAPGSSGMSMNTDRYDNSPANVYIRLATAYINRKDYETAYKNARKAVEVDPGNPNAYNLLGVVYQLVNEDARAKDAFQRALAIEPDDPYINNTYASFLCEIKDFDKSRYHFQKTINHPLYTDKHLPMTNIGICALRNDKLEIAEEYLRKALQLNGKFRNALYNMIDLSIRKNNYWSARAYLQRYLEVGKHDAKTLWWGIQTEEVLGDKNKLDSYKLLLRSKYPDSDEARLLMDMDERKK